MNLLARLKTPFQPLFTEEELPRKRKETGQYVTSTLDDVLELALKHDPSEHTRNLVLALAEITTNEKRENGYLVGFGHIKRDYGLPRFEERNIVMDHKVNPDHRLEYETAHFRTNPERILDFTEPTAHTSLFDYISQTAHDGLHLWSSQPEHGLLRNGGNADFIENGYAIRGLDAAAIDGLRDIGGKGSKAAAQFAAATQRPAIYLRSVKGSTTHFMYFEPFMQDGQRGSQTHIVALPGYEPPRGRQLEIMPVPRGIIPIADYQSQPQVSPMTLYAA